MTRIGTASGGQVEVWVDEVSKEVIVRLLTGVDEARLTTKETERLMRCLDDAVIQIYGLP